jgi:rare lipoprotein A
VPAISQFLLRNIFADWRLGGVVAITTILLATMIAGCGEVWSPNYGLRSSYSRPSRWRRSPTPVELPPGGQVVKASYYGPGFSGRRTASGERFNPNGMTAASKTLPIGSVVQVTNPENGRSVNVRINDRGPYVRGRGLDLSKGAARRIGLTQKGVARVQVTPVPAHWETATASPHRNAKSPDSVATPAYNAPVRASSENSTGTSLTTEFDE